MRLLGRVLITPPGSRRREAPLPAAGVDSSRLPPQAFPSWWELAGEQRAQESGRDGYLDLVLPAALPAERGRGAAEHRGGWPPVRAPLYVVDAGSGAGIVSDIDDTVMITALPRPMIAGLEHLRAPRGRAAAGPGMATLYRALLDANPDARWSTCPPAPGTSPRR